MKNNKIFYVYGLFRSDGRIFYIGKGKGNRKDAHFKYAHAHKNHKNHIIQKELRMGLTPYSKILCDNLTESEAFELENLSILMLGRLDNGTGVLTNLTDGGDGMSGHMPSPESRKKISDTLKGKMVGDKNPFYGKKHSEDTKQRMKQYHKDFTMFRHPSVNTKFEYKLHWLKAEFYYNEWISNGKPGRFVLSNILGIGRQQSFLRIIQFFQDGWIPNKDKDYLKFKEESFKWMMDNK